MKRRIHPYDAFMSLSDDEKARDVAKFDREFIADDSVALTRKERREWEAIKRGRGRPRKGRGAAIVSLSVEKDLLNRADALAKAQKLSRSELFSRGLRALLAANGKAA